MTSNRWRRWFITLVGCLMLVALTTGGCKKAHEKTQETTDELTGYSTIQAGKRAKKQLRDVEQRRAAQMRVIEEEDEEGDEQDWDEE